MNKLVALKTLCHKVTDGSHYSPVGIDEGFPMLSVKDMNDYGFSYANCKLISKEEYDKLVKADCKPKLNDLLIAKDGSYLKHVFVIKDEIDQAILSSIGILRPNLEKVYPDYLKYYLQTKSVKKEVAKKYVSGSALPRIILKGFEQIEIIEKDLPTQKSIAKVLSDLDAKIELNNLINQELEAMAKTLYDYWFVQFDFPNEQGKPYKSSGGKMVYNKDLKREIPEGWEVKELNDCVELIIDHRGKTPTKLGGEWSVNKNDIKALSAKIVKGGKLINLDQANRVSQDLYEKWMPKKLQDGDILMTSEAPAGEFYFIQDFTEYCLSQRLFALRANQSLIIPSYFYFELSKGHGYSQIQGSLSGSTVFGIRQDVLRTIKIVVPNIEIQTRFDKIVLPQLRQIKKLEKQNEQLTALRDWLLPMLMNGQVTVGEAEEKLNLAAEPQAEYKKG